MTYEDGSIAKLDSYEVKEVETGKVREVWGLIEGYDAYTIASDLDREDFYNKEVKPTIDWQDSRGNSSTRGIYGNC